MTLFDVGFHVEQLLFEIFLPKMHIMQKIWSYGVGEGVEPSLKEARGGECGGIIVCCFEFC